MELNDLEKHADVATELAIGYAPRLALAAITLIIGFWLAGGIAGLIGKAMRARKVDETLTPFVVSVVRWALRAAVLISAASIVGIETTSFVAVLGAAGLAVGLALQGSLSNFAGGALLLIFRPYKVGDLVETQGHLGVVKEIQIFTTTLINPNNKRIILPNGAVSNGTIVNLSAEGKLRVDLVVGISYESDIDKAQQILLEVMKSDEKVCEEPAPMVEVLELADSSVNLAVRPHATVENYWAVYFGITKKAKQALDKAGVTIPFPQRDVHLYEHKT